MTILRAIQRALADDEPREAPSQPWLGWLLVCACRHQVLITWASRVLPPLEDVAQEGTVPGHADWSYEADWEDEVVILSGPGGERFWLAAEDHDASKIDVWALLQRASGLDPCPFPESRLQRWLPDRQLAKAAVLSLEEQGLVRATNEGSFFSFAGSLDAMHGQVAAVDFSDAVTCSRWRSHLGDAEDGAAVDEQRAWLLALAEDVSDSQLLEALAKSLSDDDLVPICERAVEGPIDARCGTALELLHAREGAPSQVVERLLDRLSPEEHHPYSAWAAAQYLLERGIARERVLALSRRFADVDVVTGYGGNPFEDNWAFLFLEHAPDMALLQVRRALRSSTPACSTNMAAVMALLDQPWCHRELIAALREGSPPGQSEAQQRQGADTSRRRYLAAALLASEHEFARRLAKDLVPPAPPEREENAFGFTHDEVVHANLDAWMQDAMQRLRPMVDRLRGMLPDDFGG